MFSEVRMSMVTLNLLRSMQLRGPMLSATSALACCAVLHRWTTSALAPVESS